MKRLIALESRFKGKSFLILLLLLCITVFAPIIANDTYWIMNIGKYIVNNGFPSIDPFTIHQGLSVTIQQWLSDIIFYLLNNAFGQTGIFVVMFIVLFLNCLILYRICLTVSKKNRLLSQAIVLASVIFINLFIQSRPQIFSQLIFLLEIFQLERYIKNKKKMTLLSIVLLSILLINLHAAMWPVFFILFIPYLVGGFNYDRSSIEKSILRKITVCYNILPLAITFFASLVVGVLNPYGTQNMLYFTKAYGIEKAMNNINEMMSPDFKTALGIFVFIYIVICIIVLKLKGKICVRHALLAIGTLYMGLSSVRSLFLFFVCAAIFLASYLRDNYIFDRLFSDVRKRYINYFAVLIIVVAVIFIRQSSPVQWKSDYEPKGAVEYIKKNVDLQSMRLFNDFESGGYIEYNGIKTFIDSRCEIFAKSINKKEDIFLDYIDYIKGTLYYKDLVAKYRLTHFLVKKDDPITTYLVNDKSYKIIFSDNQFLVIEV